MKAVAVLPGPRQVRVVDRPDQRLSEPDHVELRILDVGRFPEAWSYLGPDE